MKDSRLLRTMVCLVLVCCLVINVSPIRAKALSTAAAVAIGSVAGSLALHYAMKAIGLAAGETAEAYGGILSRLDNFMTEKGWIVDGLAKVGLITNSDGVTRSYILREFIEDIRSWLWGEGEVLQMSGASVGTTLSASVGSNSYTVTGFGGRDVALICVAYTYYSSSSIYRPYVSYYEVRLYSEGKDTVYVNGKSYTANRTDNNEVYYYIVTSGSSASETYNFISPVISGDIEYIFLGDYPDSASAKAATASINPFGVSIRTQYDLTLGDVAPPDYSLSEGYSYWSAGAVSVPSSDGNSVVYYPVSIPDDSTVADSMTQPDMQIGTITDEMVDSILGSDVESDTDSGVITDSVSSTSWGTFKEWFSSKISSIVDAITSIPSSFAGWFETVIAGLNDIVTAIRSIPNTIAEAIAAVLTDAFVISDTYIQTKVDALLLKYPYLESYKGLGNDIKSFFFSLGIQPPIVYIDLGAGHLYGPIGGRTVFLDLTWYAEYKGTVDSIISAFLWLWLAWRFFLSLPGLIQGQSGIWHGSDGISDLDFHSRASHYWRGSGSDSSKGN